jgi:hypothetical protein
MVTVHKNSSSSSSSSMALQPFVGLWPLLQFLIIFTQTVIDYSRSRCKSRISGPPLTHTYIHTYTDGRTPWTSDQPVARPLPTHRITQKQNKRTHKHPYLECDFEPTIPVRASEDSLCLRPRGYCGR